LVLDTGFLMLDRKENAMSWFKIVLLIYGLLMLVGGYMGWAKAASKASLIAGVLSSVLIFLGTYLLGINAKVGQIVVTVVSGLLSLIFVMRFLKTQAFMPAGLLLLLSVAVFALCLSQVLRKV